MNENQSVLGAICSGYDTYFEAEKKIADCIIARGGEVIDMTVAKLARASGTSDATVSRFCRRCGFNSFQHLKMSLAREVMETGGKSIQVSNDIMRQDLPQSLQNILANKITEITQTVNMIDPDVLEQVLELLEQAGTVQVAAVGNTIPVALDFCFKMNQIGITTVTGTIWEAQMAYTLNLKPADVLVIISNSGISKRLQTLLQGARENGVKVIAITNNAGSPIGRLSDHRIITATLDKLLLEEFCFSRVPAMMVVEILYLMLEAGSKSARESLWRHEVAMSEDKAET